MTMHGGRESIHFMNTSWSLTRESISLIPAIPAKNLIAAVDYELFGIKKFGIQKEHCLCDVRKNFVECGPGAHTSRT